MNRSAHTARFAESKNDELLYNVLVWVLFGLSCVMLAWFVNVINDFTERGEQRRIQQRTTGSLVLADEQPQRASLQGAGVMAVGDNLLASR